MTARPGKIKEKIKVPLKRPRGYEVKDDRIFLKIKKQVLDFIREESIKAANAG